MMRCLEHIGHRHVVQEVDGLPLCRIPDRLHFASIDDRAIIVPPIDTTVELQGTFNGFDHFQERDLTGGPGQRVSSVGALLRPHDAMIGENGQDLGQEGLEGCLWPWRSR